MKELIDRLYSWGLSDGVRFLCLASGEYDEKYFLSPLTKVRRKCYGTGVYLRGLIEILNYCKMIAYIAESAECV